MARDERFEVEGVWEDKGERWMDGWMGWWVVKFHGQISVGIDAPLTGRGQRERSLLRSKEKDEGRGSITISPSVQFSRVESGRV